MGSFKPKDIRDMMEADIQRLKDRSLKWAKEKPKIWGFPTGLPDLDHYSGGLVQGELITLAGGPGSGKTSLGLQMLEQAAGAIMREGQPFVNVVVSAEMDRFNLYMRSACRLAHVDSDYLRRGSLEKAELDRFHAQLDYLQSLPILIVDSPGFRSLDVRNLLLMLAAEGLSVGVCLVDYIQCLADDGDNVNVRVSAIMRNLKDSTKESGCCMLALSQYSRAKEREKRPPILQDLRDSGSVEQDSYQVWAMHLPEPDAEFLNNPLKKRELFILKNRNGKLGKVHLDFNTQYTQFSEPMK